MRYRVAVCLIVVVFAVGARHGSAAFEHSGRVIFRGLPVPGATVTATHGDQQRITVTDQQGIYRLANLADGVWTIRIDMLGFATITQEFTISADAPSPTFALTLLPFEEIARGLQATEGRGPAKAGRYPEDPPSRLNPSQPTAADPAPPSSAPAGFQPATMNASNGASTAPNEASVFGNATAVETLNAADGFVINGSVNNGAASPFAQLPAFGNNRRGSRSLYTGGVGVILGNSAWDARPFSFTNQPPPKPAYHDVQLLGTFGGPLNIPGVIRSGPNFFIGYQRTADHNASTQSARVPTSLERSGDFSQTRDGLGRPVQIIDPTTGLPFAGNTIRSGRISPQALALMNLYPQPNIDGTGRYNYQAPVFVATHQDNVQTRLTQTINARNQLFGNIGYQRTTTDTASLFGFQDSTRVSSLDAAVNWSHRFSQFFSLRMRYQFTRVTTQVTPNFSNRANVSGDAGVTGNDQDPLYWGPPTLIFSTGVAGLTDAQYGSNHNQTHTWAAEGFWSHGRHNVTFGGGVHRNHVDVLSQQDPRGTFAFTGAATGSDLGDFLLGLPHTSSIAFGNADKYLRASTYEAYLTDDWRLSPTFTANVGVRWEYEAPMDELFGRLTNLEITPGFGAVSPVVASNPVGTLTGQSYPASLLRPDRRGVQPRLGVAWRPVPGSSLVIRAGYGVYRNNSVYQSIDLLLAQQPPLSKTFSVENSLASPFTLANAFTASPTIVGNTFAVDPDFRVGFAQNWQVSVQRDLPGSLTMIATYLGAKGSHLMQESLPNTYPAGAPNPCPTCPAGFVYLTSDGTSNREAGQFQLRRRLRNGLTATVQYTLSKATDDAGAFTGVSLTGAAIAQDWLHLEAERAPSNFDQRHLLTAQVQYTTGLGVGGGALLDGLKGSLLKGWTMTSQLTAGSGLPLTPVYLTSVTGTGVTGTLRADLTGASMGAVPAGYYANPAAYAAPPLGRWGNAGRNSIRGPAQFGLNAGVGRTFLWGDRLNLDWRIDLTNVLNRVTYANVNTIVGSPQFGLPTLANPMRRVQTSLRLRF